MASLGYDDTPVIPGSTWRVHDIARPQPRIVAPGCASTQAMAGCAPSDAVILFNGLNLDRWQGKDGGAAKWKIEHGYMEVVPGTGHITTREHFGDCQLHVEFASPTEIVGESQGRGNSGIFLMGQYEFQVLDCFENPTYADGTVGAIYGQYPPLVNASRRPGQWQMYDIVWEGPRFKGEELVRAARVTIILNGVVVQHGKELQGPTQHRKTTEYKAHPEVGPLMLQDHKNPVRFRNIWYRPLRGYDEV